MNNFHEMMKARGGYNVYARPESERERKTKDYYQKDTLVINRCVYIWLDESFFVRQAT